jgi:hypothetical protein
LRFNISMTASAGRKVKIGTTAIKTQVSTWSKCRLVVGFIASITSCALFKVAHDDRQKNRDTLQGECSVVDFYVDPVINVTCTQCKFIVQLLVPDMYDIFVTYGWSPAFHTTYSTGHSSGHIVVPKHPGFSCCPTRQVLDCCGFFDKVSDTFCDNWGASQPNCPVAPWPCHLKNAASYVNHNVGAISPHDLQEGSCQEWKLYLGIAAALAGIGMFMFVLEVLPGSQQRMKRRPGQKERDEAARVIQSWVRGSLVRRSAVGERVKARRARAKSLLKRRKHDFAFSLPGQCESVAALAKSEALKATPRIIAPLPASQNPFQRYFKDTGTGHRLVQSRVISLPGDPIERLQIALSPMDGQLGVKLVLPKQEDEDPRPVVQHVKPGSKAEACGLREGHRLTSVAGHHAEAMKPQKLIRLINAPHSELISAVFEFPPPKPPKVDDLRHASWADIVSKHKIEMPMVSAPCPKRPDPKWNMSPV